MLFIFCLLSFSIGIKYGMLKNLKEEENAKPSFILRILYSLVPAMKVYIIYQIYLLITKLKIIFGI